MRWLGSLASSEGERIVNSISVAAPPTERSCLKRIKEILLAEADAINAVEVDDTFVAAVEALCSCPGKVIVTGMGKAGVIAHKLSAMLNSTATPAMFVHPAEATCGELGAVAEGDCIIALSTSGKTREVLEFIEYSRLLMPYRVIGITSHPDSRLRFLCDIVVSMGVIVEPCPLGLTPTASMAVMSAIGDALAIVLMERKGISRKAYGLRHHGECFGVRADASARPAEASKFDVASALGSD